MSAVRVVSVGCTDHTTALPGDALVRVLPEITYWHQTGNLHRLTVTGGAVVETIVPRTSIEYLAGMAQFATDGD